MAWALAEGSALDYDQASRHEIGVEVTDSGGLSYTETLALAVSNENLAPTGVTLTDGAVAENAEPGTPVDPEVALRHHGARGVGRHRAVGPSHSARTPGSD